jgi:hypothetical protein
MFSSDFVFKSGGHGENISDFTAQFHDLCYQQYIIHARQSLSPESSARNRGR